MHVCEILKIHLCVSIRLVKIIEWSSFGTGLRFYQNSINAILNRIKKTQHLIYQKFYISFHMQTLIKLIS